MQCVVDRLPFPDRDIMAHLEVTAAACQVQRRALVMTCPAVGQVITKNETFEGERTVFDDDERTSFETMSQVQCVVDRLPFPDRDIMAHLEVTAAACQVQRRVLEFCYFVTREILTHSF